MPEPRRNGQHGEGAVAGAVVVAVAVAGAVAAGEETFSVGISLATSTEAFRPVQLTLW